jgi:hypothetical protein
MFTDYRKASDKIKRNKLIETTRENKQIQPNDDRNLQTTF